MAMFCITYYDKSGATTSKTVINNHLYFKVHTCILHSHPAVRQHHSRFSPLLSLRLALHPMQSHLLRAPVILHRPCSSYHCSGICRKRTKERKKRRANEGTQTGLRYLGWLRSSGSIIEWSRQRGPRQGLPNDPAIRSEVSHEEVVEGEVRGWGRVWIVIKWKGVLTVIWRGG